MIWHFPFSSENLNQVQVGQGRLQTAVLGAKRLPEILSVGRPRGECQACRRPQDSWQSPPRADRWACDPQWAGLAVDPPTNVHPMLTGSRGSLCPSVKAPLLRAPIIGQAQHSTHTMSLSLKDPLRLFHHHPWFSATEAEAHRGELTAQDLVRRESWDSNSGCSEDES